MFPGESAVTKFGETIQCYSYGKESYGPADDFQADGGIEFIELAQSKVDGYAHDKHKKGINQVCGG